MYKEHCIAVTIPAYNEEPLILSVIEAIPSYVDHIIVVDDCSSDNTYNTVANSHLPKTILLSTGRNQGVGGAMIAGYKKALELGSDIVVKMDGDGQMLPEYLASLLDAVIDDGFAYAKGNRFLVPEFLSQMPRHRLIGNIILTFLTKLASGYWQIFDPQNGYTAIRAETLRSLNLSTIYKRFFFENDMLVKINIQNGRVKDVAISSKYGNEVSSLNVFQIVFTFPLLFLRRWTSRIYYKYVLRDFSPIALFLFLGLGLFFWGVAFGAYVWIHSISSGVASSTGTVMLSVLPLILGFQLLLQAIVLDIQETPR